MSNENNKILVRLQSIEDVKTFVNLLTRFDCDFDFVSGRYVIDAKSIMGIFSLDLSHALELVIHTDEPLLSEIIEGVRAFIV